FQKVIKEVNATIPMEIEREEVNVSERLKQIFHRLQETKEVVFEDLLRERLSKVFVIVSFLSVLELVRLKKIKISQVDSDSSIYLRFVEGAVEEDLVESEFDGLVAESSEPATAQEVIH